MLMLIEKRLIRITTKVSINAALFSINFTIKKSLFFEGIQVKVCQAHSSIGSKQTPQRILVEIENFGKKNTVFKRISRTSCHLYLIYRHIVHSVSKVNL